jgi:hypothetical protein
LLGKSPHAACGQGNRDQGQNFRFGSAPFYIKLCIDGATSHTCFGELSPKVVAKEMKKKSIDFRNGERQCLLSCPRMS